MIKINSTLIWEGNKKEMGFRSELIYDKVAIFKIFSYLLFHNPLIGVGNLVLVSPIAQERNEPQEGGVTGSE